jgi:hypothetical protein
LDGIGRQRKPRRPLRSGNATAMDAGHGEENQDGDDGATFVAGTSG